MTNTILEIAGLNILWIWGFYAACKVDFHDDENPQLGYDKDSRMILWKVKKWSLKNLGTLWSKPVCTCPACMSSLHGVPFYIALFIILNLKWYFIFFMLIYCTCLAGVNYFISLFVNKLEQ